MYRKKIVYTERHGHLGYYVIQKNNEKPYIVKNIITNGYLSYIRDVYGGIQPIPAVIVAMATGYGDTQELPTDTSLEDEKSRILVGANKVPLGDGTLTTNATFKYSDFPTAPVIEIRELGTFTNNAGDAGTALNTGLMVSRITFTENLSVGEQITIYRSDVFSRF